jgi:hypothetical protein
MFGFSMKTLPYELHLYFIKNLKSCATLKHLTYALQIAKHMYVSVE